MVENIRSLVRGHFTPLSFRGVFQTLQKTVTCFHWMAHFQTNLRKLSHSAVEMVWLIQRTPLSSLSSSFHPCSAYPLSSNLVLLCRWWAGAIIGSLRLTLEQNVRRFKAACQSALCADSPLELPRLFIACITNRGAQRQREEETLLFMDYPAPPAPVQGPELHTDN